MKISFRHILSNNIIKTGFFNSASVGVKIVASIVSSKVLAHFLGPSGMGLLGIFKEFFNMSANVGSMGFTKGIISYASALKNDKKVFTSFSNTVGLLGLIFSSIFGILIFALSKELSYYLFGSDTFVLVFKILAFAIPFSVLSIFLLALLTGLGYDRKVIKINILVYILNMFSLVILAYLYGVKGALIGISLVYIFQLISIFIFKPNAFDWNILKAFKISKIYTKKIFGYSVMTLISLILFPFISILIRETIINVLDQESAGYWEAMKRISENYLLFASSLVLLIVLPKLSEKNALLKKVVWDFYKSVIPFFILFLIIIFSFKKFIVLLFFSDEFLPMLTLFKWYLLGDIFRVLGVVLAANFFAKRNILGYILTDMFLAVIMCFSTIALIKYYGLDGGGLAYLISYVAYFIVLLFVFYKSLFLTPVDNSIND